MKVLTEEILRTSSKNKPLEEVVISKDTIITPSAREFINGQKISIVYEEDKLGKIEDEKLEDKLDVENTPKYFSYYSNKPYTSKPEYMTHINGNKLVYKTNKRIKFRGKIDSFQSKILIVQALAGRENKEKLIGDLEEILEIVRKTLRAEVMEEELKIEKILGYTEDEIRDMSHYPDRYFGMKHILPNYQMDYLLLLVNELRTYSRELELVAMKTFKVEDGYVREDILKTLNRLSSSIYVIMYKYLKSEY